MSHALRLFDIHKRYRVGLGSCRATVEALRGVTLDVRPAEVVVITGRPGSGKRTLLMCAAGLLRPDRGRVRWFGQRASPVGRPPGVVYRSVPSHYGCMTVTESLTHVLLRRGVTPTDNALRLALDRVGIGDAASVRLSRLGAGELRRLRLAEMLLDRKSTRLNSSHLVISYAVFCLKKKKTTRKIRSDEKYRRKEKLVT